jgi:hypothetical protein
MKTLKEAGVKVALPKKRLHQRRRRLVEPLKAQGAPISRVPPYTASADHPASLYTRHLVRLLRRMEREESAWKVAARQRIAHQEMHPPGQGPRGPASHHPDRKGGGSQQPLGPPGQNDSPNSCRAVMARHAVRLRVQELRVSPVREPLIAFGPLSRKIPRRRFHA